MLKHVVATLKIVTVCIGLVVWAGTAQAAAIVGLSVDQNGLSFGPGDTIRVTLGARNIGGPPLTGDFYFGVIHPDGVTATFIVSRSPLVGVARRLDGDPQSFPPLVPNVVLPTGFDTTISDFFVHTLSSEPVGNYRFFAVLTTPRAFANGLLEPSDLIMTGFSGFAISSASRGPRR